MRNKLGTITFVIIMLTLEAGLISLGIWQYNRWQYKLDLAAKIEDKLQLPAVKPSEFGADTLYRKTILSGRFDPARSKILTNQRLGDQVGARLITPFLLNEPHQTMVVDRGWLTKAQEQKFWDNREIPGDTFTFTGIVLPVPPLNQTGWLAGPIFGTDKRTLMRLDLAAVLGMGEDDKMMAPTIYIHAITPTLDDILTDMSAEYMQPQKHVEYMLTWALLAFLLPLMLIGWLRARR